MTRSNKKKITDESYDNSEYTTTTYDSTGAAVAPNGAVTGTVRFPEPGVTFPTKDTIESPVDYCIVRNRSASDLRIAFDEDASNTNGHVLHAGEDGGFPRRMLEYLSLWGGDGTAIELHFYWW